MTTNITHHTIPVMGDTFVPRLARDGLTVRLVGLGGVGSIVGRYLAIFDSLGAREIGYSLSKDGLTWPLETRLTAQTGSNKWAGDGDHDMRTVLCAVREDDGTFTVVYTAKMKDRGFWAVGKCTLGWDK